MLNGKKIVLQRGISKFLIISFVVFIVGCFLHFSFGTYSYTASEGDPHVVGVDDAYIAYRYGWNLVHYNTLSWNESGFRRTEGFTNPLWVYISALWSLPGDKDLVYPGMVLTSFVITIILIGSLFHLIFKNSGCSRSFSGKS